jgi:GT2 family glycosyltransferase
VISVVCVTCNRLHLLRDVIDKVIARTSDAVTEIVLWNNHSSDGTTEYLDGLTDPRIKVIHHPENIGVNAYAEAFKHTTEHYLIELDDDIIDAPEHWDHALLDAYRKLDGHGFLASNIIDDGKSVSAEIFYRTQTHRFTPAEVNGVRLINGPVGGYCTMTDRETMNAVGGFPQRDDETFFHEDALYVERVLKHGKQVAILADLKVFHASGPAYSSDPTVAAAKASYYTKRDARRERRRRIKRALHALPLMPMINRRLKLYNADSLHG